MKGRNGHDGAWTVREDDVLFAEYEQRGAIAVSERTGRTVNAVRNRARYYGLRCVKWSKRKLADTA